MVAKREPKETAEWQPERRLFSIDEYERMAEAGVLHEDSHVELLDGEVLCMAAIGARHSACLSRFYECVQATVSATAIVRIQMPIRLPPRSEPEPDAVLVRRREDHYEAANPGPEDVLLLVEVADSSLLFDRERKLPRYAAAGVPETWIFDIGGDRALVHRRPRGRRYTDVSIVERGGTLTPLAFPGLTLKLDDVLGPPAQA